MISHLFKIFTGVALMIFSLNATAQCDVTSSVCQSGTSQNFEFTATSGPYAGGSFANAGCATGAGGVHEYGFITLNISESGPLNLLIDGDGTNGFIDVAIFNIPDGEAPCDAVLDANNAIGCNFASNASGCVQFGNAFPCPSSVPAPNVVAGQEIMIIAQNYSTNGSIDFNLELGPAPSAQSGSPDAEIDPVDPVCLSDSPFQINATNLGGDWSGPGVSNSGMFDPAAAGVGTHTINYTIGVAPCDDSDQIQITVNPGSTVTADIVGAGNSITICEGESVDLEATGASTYDWDNGVGAGANHTVSPTSTTTYTVEGTDADGCIDSDMVTVNVSPAVTIDVSPDETICATESTEIEAIASGGTTFEYYWSHTASNDGVQTVTPDDEETTYSVYAENEFGCESDSRDIDVDWHPEPTGVISEDQSICLGDFADISATGSGGSGGPYSYSWSDPSGTNISNEQSISVNPTTTTTYEVEINDNCGTLPITMNVEVVVNPLPEVAFSVDLDNECVPATFEITNDTDPGLVEETYWTFSDGQTMTNMDNFEVTIDEAGVYDLSLIVVSPEGCVDSTSVNEFLTVHPQPKANFNFVPDPVTMLNTEVLFQNYSSGADSYQWYFEEGDPDFSTLEDPVSTFPEGVVEDYDVELIANSIHDCKDTARAIIQVESDVIIYAPNAFTPDGDEHNPRWKVFIDGIDVKVFDLEIYNRWGELIWESHNPEIGWDGTYGTQSGKRVEEGTYIWKVRARDFITDKKYEWQGHVTILY